MGSRRGPPFAAARSRRSRYCVGGRPYAASAYVRRADPHEAVPNLAGPRLQVERADASKLVGVHDLLGGTDHVDAPPAARGDVVGVDFEDDFAVQCCRDQFLAGCSTEYDVAVEHRVQDREDAGPAGAYGDATHRLCAKERVTLVAVDDLEAVVAHGSSTHRDGLTVDAL